MTEAGQPITPRRPSLLGEVVLLLIDPADELRPPVYRPFLVTSDQGRLVGGELFLVWADDRRSVWCRHHMFYAPSPANRTVDVPAASHGQEVGQWIYREEHALLTQETSREAPEETLRVAREEEKENP